MVEVGEITCECDPPQVPYREAIREEDLGCSYVPEELVDAHICASGVCAHVQWHTRCRVVRAGISNFGY